MCCAFFAFWRFWLLKYFTCNLSLVIKAAMAFGNVRLSAILPNKTRQQSGRLLIVFKQFPVGCSITCTLIRGVIQTSSSSVGPVCLSAAAGWLFSDYAQIAVIGKNYQLVPLPICVWSKELMNSPDSFVDWDQTSSVESIGILVFCLGCACVVNATEDFVVVWMHWRNAIHIQAQLEACCVLCNGGRLSLRLIDVAHAVHGVARFQKPTHRIVSVWNCE